MSDAQPDFVEFFKILDDSTRELYAKDGQPCVYTLFQSKAGPIAGVLFDNSPANDEAIMQIMQMLAAAFEAVHFGCAMDSWMAAGKKGDPKPSEHPDKQEAVPIIAFQRGSPMPSMNTYLVKRTPTGERQLELLDNEWTQHLESSWGPKVLRGSTNPLAVMAARAALLQSGFPVKDALSGAVHPGAEVMEYLRAMLQVPREAAMLGFLEGIAKILQQAKEQKDKEGEE